MSGAKASEAGVSSSKKLTIEDVVALGKVLIAVSDRHPIRYRTERDFYPLVEAYLAGRVPKLTSESVTMGGVIDFLLGGTNPTALEIAVQPRAMQDPDASHVRFAGHEQANSLLPSQNNTELKKLGAHAAKTAFLLLVDLRGTCNTTPPVDGYRSLGKTLRLKRAVRVVYVSRDTRLPLK